jgi:hypothetical protein
MQHQHLAEFLAAYNFAKRLSGKLLSQLLPLLGLGMSFPLREELSDG